MESKYWFVEMGPIPNRPDWHMKLYAHQAYAFPTEAAAGLFASTHKRRDPLRRVEVRFPDGSMKEV
jgi:hypothetical protein